MITAIRDANFGSVHGPALVLFHARWCPYCTEFMPAYREAEAMLKKSAKTKDLKVYAVDVDLAPAATKRMDVASYPTLVFVTPEGRTKIFTGKRTPVNVAAFASACQSRS